MILPNGKLLQRITGLSKWASRSAAVEQIWFADLIQVSHFGWFSKRFQNPL